MRPVAGASAALASRLGARLLGLAFLILLARHQSLRTFAAYNYLLALAATVSTITDAGVALVANREVASGETDLVTAYRAAAPTQGATSLLAGAAVLVLGSVIPGPVSSHWAVVWTALFVFLTGLFNGQAELLRGSGRPWVEAGLQVLGAVMQVGIGIAVVFAGYGLAALMAVLAVKQLFVMLVAQLWLPHPFGRSDRTQQRNLLKRGLWLGAATTFGALSMRLGQLVLGNVGSTGQIAQFAVAARYLDIAATVCATVSFGLLPAMVQRSRRRTPNTADFNDRLLRVGLCTSIVLAVAVVPLVPWLTTSVFGERYRGATSASQIFVACLPVLTVMYLAWYGLVAEKLERRASSASLAGFLVTLAGSLWIVAEKTSTSAAVITVAGLATTAAVALLFLKRTSRP